MTRLQLEWQRLYAVPAAPDPGLIDASGQVRALVLQLARPADWAALSAVWHGVQADLGLPAPGIAVTGLDGYQLWFSLQQPVPAAQAVAFLDTLRRRHLGEVKLGRVSLWPEPDASSPTGARHAAPVPAPQGDGSVWSAFVAPDLAPVFADEPWLDSPPNEAGQSELLSRLKSIPPEDFQLAMQQLLPARAEPSAALSPDTRHRDPRHFLLEVMNDERVDLALRIEAAKALLSQAPGSPPGRD